VKGKGVKKEDTASADVQKKKMISKKKKRRYCLKVDVRGRTRKRLAASRMRIIEKGPDFD
jgi:hypothetical protein